MLTTDENFPEATGVLKLIYHMFKGIRKVASSGLKQFQKAASTHINGFPKAVGLQFSKIYSYSFPVAFGNLFIGFPAEFRYA
jgi:hypothetical protein